MIVNGEQSLLSLPVDTAPSIPHPTVLPLPPTLMLMSFSYPSCSLSPAWSFHFTLRRPRFHPLLQAIPKEYLAFRKGACQWQVKFWASSASVIKPLHPRPLCWCMWESHPEKNVDRDGNRLSEPLTSVISCTVGHPAAKILNFRKCEWLRTFILQPVAIQGRAKKGLAHMVAVWDKQQHLDRADIASKQNSNWLGGVLWRHMNAPAVLSQRSIGLVLGTQAHSSWYDAGLSAVMSKRPADVRLPLSGCCW